MESKQRSIFTATVIGGLLFGFVAGRVWSERNTIKGMIAETKTATTTLVAKSLTASSGVVEAKKEIVPVVKKTDAKQSPVQTTTTSKTKETSSLVLSEITAGSRVSFSRVILSRDGWIAIREDIDGDFGKVLGAGWFPKGVNNEVVVELLRNTEAGKKYYAVLYTDAGDHQFSVKVNSVITSNGKEVYKVFTAK